MVVRRNCSTVNAIGPRNEASNVAAAAGANETVEHANIQASTSAVLMVAAGSLEMAASPLVEDSSTSSSSRPPKVPSSSTSPPPPNLPISSVSLAKTTSTTLVAVDKSSSSPMVISEGSKGGEGGKRGGRLLGRTMTATFSGENVDLERATSRPNTAGGDGGGGVGTGVGGGLRRRLMEAALAAGRQIQSRQGLNGGGGGEGNGVDGGDANTAGAVSSSSSFDIRGWLTCRAWFSFAFFLLLAIRYLSHLSMYFKYIFLNFVIFFLSLRLHPHLGGLSTSSLYLVSTSG